MSIKRNLLPSFRNVLQSQKAFVKMSQTSVEHESGMYIHRFEISVNLDLLGHTYEQKMPSALAHEL